MMMMEVLAGNEMNPTYDAGLYQPAKIGDIVWEDINGNGIQDETNTGVGNVRVFIAGTDGANNSYSDTTTTDGTGMYMFGGLRPGTYQVSMEVPTGYELIPSNEGTNDSLDSDTDENGIMTMEILTSGENNPTYDMGIYRPAKIGNFVWEDTNGNGLQDETGTGVTNVVVTLIGTTGTGVAVADTTTTDGVGMYMFGDLAPGNYQVKVVAPTGYEIAYINESTNDSLDSDIAENGLTAIETLVSGENNPTYDAGIYQPAKLGDYVWNDANANGIQDDSEVGIGNVEMHLVGTDGAGNAVTDTTFTDGTGMYMFGDLVPGTYTVSVVAPTDYMLTYNNEGVNDSLDSDANEQGVLTETVIVSGENNPTLDAGLYLDARIGNYVWEDTNGNGIQDETGTGIANVEVQITGTSGNGTGFMDTTFTDNTGMYYFNNLVPGTYHIDVVPPVGYEITYALEGANDSLDSNIDENGMMMLEILVGNEMNPTYDAGLYQPAKIGDIVWEDINGNGIQDETGTGVAGVEVRLAGTDGAGNLVTDTTQTDGTGMYMFGGLRPGTYQVSMETPTGYVIIDSNEGSNDSLDSDVDEQGVTIMEVLTSGENNPTYDMGIYRPAKIGDIVWEDTNGNGIQDETGTGVANVEVILIGTEGAGNPVADTTLTDNTGMYMFGDLAPGDYQIKIITPVGYEIAYINESPNDSLDSDIDANGLTAIETLISGEVNPTYDAGIYQSAKLGDLVWNDLNANGLQDNTEVGIGNVEVILSGTDGAGNPVTDTTITDPTGMYMFGDLVPGTYTVSVVAPTDYMLTYNNEGVNDSLDSDANEQGILTATVLVSGENNPTLDAGLYLDARIGNYVWKIRMVMVSKMKQEQELPM